MFRKKRPGGPGNQETAAEDQVRLKPILGVRPGVYLFFIYALVTLAVLFFILMYPGLSRPGSAVVFKTEPAGAALRVDGIYMGTSPGKVFVPRGVHAFELILPNFPPLTFDEEIGGRLFASLLFPRIHTVEKELSTADPLGAFAGEAADYAAWSFAGEPTAAYQIPLSLSEGAYRIGPSAANQEAVDEILKAASRFGTTRAALRDLVRAKFLADNRGLSPSPVGLLHSAGDIIGFLSETPGAAPWLAGILPPEAASRISASSWYTRQIDESGKLANSEHLPSAPAGRFRLGPLSFTALPGGVLVQSSVFPHTVDIGEFRISETEVSAAAYGAFLSARPQWGRENLESLREQGLATGDYLAEGASPEGTEAITQISWYAAGAYCAWLSTLLPPSMEGYEVRLPTEAEWEYAAKTAGNRGAPDITGFRGGNWEWCGDPYAPLNFIAVSPEAAEAAGSPERPVRGGSRANPGSSVTPETRASLPPAMCSPFVSFRPVIAPKRSGPNPSPSGEKP
ncbi:MAG: formylglycine-generating enzyme family protein [Treponema sp.]|jgi:formylglycine-generating enzyme required for sulfatase activity|nr:formylglycine-generating enzyme family protein [Treponema sp.]